MTVPTENCQSLIMWELLQMYWKRSHDNVMSHKYWSRWLHRKDKGLSMYVGERLILKIIQTHPRSYLSTNWLLSTSFYVKPPLIFCFLLSHVSLLKLVIKCFINLIIHRLKLTISYKANNVNACCCAIRWDSASHRIVNTVVPLYSHKHTYKKPRYKHIMLRTNYY